MNNLWFIQLFNQLLMAMHGIPFDVSQQIFDWVRMYDP